MKIFVYGKCCTQRFLQWPNKTKKFVLFFALLYKSQVFDLHKVTSKMPELVIRQ